MAPTATIPNTIHSLFTANNSQPISPSIAGQELQPLARICISHSVAEDQEWFLAKGRIKEKVDQNVLIDMSYMMLR